MSYWESLEVERLKNNQLYKTKMSSFFSLNWKDIGKGIAMAVLTPIVGYILQVLTAGNFAIDPQKILILAATGFCAYVLKQLGTDSQGNLLGIGSVRE